MAVFLTSCSIKLWKSDVWEGDAGKVRNGKGVNQNDVYCLRDFLIGEDSMGVWEVVSEPVGANLDTLLVGDNPCIEWGDKPCGLYQLRYIVGDSCCRDTAIIQPLKCCLTGISECS